MKKIVSLILMLTLLATLCTALVSCGNSYDNLMIVDLGFENEYFGIAFRSGSDMTRKVEDITAQLFADGKMAEISSKYDAGAVNAEDYVPSADPCTGSGDFEYIKNKGTLVIGITDYKPMDYRADNGEWIGFDADYARAVCEALDVTPVFKEIVWDYKLTALAAKEIDCIWNGMTITEAIEEAADCTEPYMFNKQVAVIQKKNAELYKSLSDLEGVSLAAEGGSAGAKVIGETDALKDGLKEVDAQTDALTEVLSGASEAAIVDYILAKALIRS